jgi:large subunit ribosomal protein L17
MRHGKKINHLGRTASHRKALLSNMATSLILHKRINTTVAKAKELRKYIEPLITKAKDDTTHSRRVVFSYLQNKESVKILFNEVAQRISDWSESGGYRPGGYTRIIKTGNRLGDNSEMCLIELVDFNDNLLKKPEDKKAKTRRGRRGKGSRTEEVTATPDSTDAAVTGEEKEQKTASKVETAPKKTNAKKDENAKKPAKDKKSGDKKDK